jgi:hypothetical protein
VKISKALRGNRDLPQLESTSVAGASAGTASDAAFEQVIAVIPDLTKSAPTGTAGMQANNAMQIRWFLLSWLAAITGAATNNCSVQLKQWRGGAVLTNTTSSTAVGAAGSATITVGAGGANNCYVGQYLDISGGTGTAETIVVTAFSAVGNTITANFANTHSGTYNVVSTPLASVTYANATNDAARVPRQIAAFPNTVKPGDVLTVVRVSAGTGLATPAGSASIEWVEAGPQ